MEDDEVLEEEVFERGNDSYGTPKKGALNQGEEDGDEVLEEAVFDKRAEEDEEITARDAVQTVKEIYGEYKKAYSHASKHDKAKILLILLPLAITLILGFVGIVVANVGQMFRLWNVELTGIIIIALGFGGFFITIVLIAVISKFKGNK